MMACNELQYERNCIKRVGLRKAISIMGGTEIELHRAWGYIYGFFNLNDQLMYVYRNDLPTSGLGTLTRTAKHRKDWTGGPNQWDFDRKLTAKGYTIKPPKPNKRPN